MIFPELFKSLEQTRWSLADDIPWEIFDGAKLSDEQARTVKATALAEWSALSLADSFLRDHRDDRDLSAFLAVWLYEEQKHALVLTEYLRRFRPELAPDEDELRAARYAPEPAAPLETLMRHFCDELRLTHGYRVASDRHTEPVLKHIYDLLSRDEARHGGAFLRYMRRAVERGGDAARAAFARVGARAAAAPNPEWPGGADAPERFGAGNGERVGGGILRHLSGLCGEKFDTPADLDRYCRRFA